MTVNKNKVGFIGALRLIYERMHGIATETNGIGNALEREIIIEHKESEAPVTPNVCEKEG